MTKDMTFQEANDALAYAGGFVFNTPPVMPTAQQARDMTDNEFYARYLQVLFAQRGVLMPQADTPLQPELALLRDGSFVLAYTKTGTRIRVVPTLPGEYSLATAREVCSLYLALLTCDFDYSQDPDGLHSFDGYDVGTGEWNRYTF